MSDRENVEFEQGNELFPMVEPEERVDYLDTGTVAETESVDFQAEPPRLPVSDEMLESDLELPEASLHYGKGLEHQGYSPTTALTPDNAGDLSKEYELTTEAAGLQVNPTIVPSDPPVMYYTTGDMKVFARNALTGDRYWRFSYSFDEPTAGQTGKNRGVAVRENRVFFGATDAHMIALNRYTGEKVWETDSLSEKQANMNKPERITFTQAPIAHDGRIYIGQSGDFFGWCEALAFDADSGDILWRQNMAPEEFYVGDTWSFVSNAPWMNPSVDPETNTVLWAVGNPTPMFNGLVRPGTNKHSNSIVAIDAESGEMNWEYQIIPHEIWDYDAHTTPVIFDAQIDGETRRVIGHDNKPGWFYLHDLETGRLLERSQSLTRQQHIPANRDAPDDAFFLRPGVGQENALEIWPNTDGHTEWPPDAYSPDTGLRYIGKNISMKKIWMEYGINPTSLDLAQGGGWEIPSHPDKSTFVTAYDPVNGNIVWEHEIGGIPWTGGTAVTAGNVVLHGTSGGNLIALDAGTGEKLNDLQAGGRVTASPVVWEYDGTAYVALAANNRISVFSA